MKTIFVRIFAAAILFISLPQFSSAQSDSPDAHLEGTLLDSSGAGVGGVQVIAQLSANPQAPLWKARSTTDGEYSLSLPPGKYHIIFQRTSFMTREFELDLAAGPVRTLDLKLQLQPVSSSVVVTGETAPLPIKETSASVTTITRDDIDARVSITLPDALLSVPNLSIGRTGPEGGSTSVFLNGGNSAFSKVLVDGTPVNEPGNAVDFSNFTLDNIDKVEIVRGAESALYGTDAVSGVIQVISHRGSTRVPELDLFANGGTFSTGRGGAQLSGLLGNFDYSTSASYFQTAGPHDLNAFINRTRSGNFGYRLGEDNHFRLTLRNTTSNAQTPGQVLLTPPSPDSHIDYHFFSSNARWDFATGKHWHHELMGAESYNRQFTADPIQSFYIQAPNSFCPQDSSSPNAVATTQFCDFTDPGSRYRYNRASLNAQSSYLLPNFSATAGYQFEVENGSIPFLAAGHVRRNNEAGFLDFRYAPHPRASLSFGMRAEANGYFGTRVVPRAGVSLALLQGRGFWGETRFRLLYGQGIKEPRFDQLFNDHFGDIGNPNLKPEASKTWTAGIEQKLGDDHAKVMLEYFANRFEDLISFAFCFPLAPPAIGNTCGIVVPAGTPASFGYFFNTDRARARGFNLSSEVRAARWLRFTGNYTFDDSRVIAAPNTFDPSELPGNHLIRRPVNSGSFSAFFAWRRTRVALATYATGQRTDSDFLGLGLTHTPGYARVDFATTYQFTRELSADVRVANLVDKSYQDALGYPALGRELRIGLRYRLGGKT